MSGIQPVDMMGLAGIVRFIWSSFFPVSVSTSLQDRKSCSAVTTNQEQKYNELRDFPYTAFPFVMAGIRSPV
ncbi:hypothetical protein GCK32_012820 [Trichostrongylus colubriformis]|uniref:Uncharacterized protein n=1 Tax=Trichostrongylus colubriformis TaxID=6319 RepID=A0AAN8FGH1_TRICO